MLTLDVLAFTGKRLREKCSPGRAVYQVYSCMHNTIQTISTSEQKENVISLMSSFVFGSISRFQG